MLENTKTSSSLIVETKLKSSIRLNCDWEVEKLVVYEERNEKKGKYQTFTGSHAQFKFITYVEGLIKEEHEVTVVLEIGRCAFEAPRILQTLGADVHLIAVSKIEALIRSKSRKTDRLDAKFLSTLNLETAPRVWIPSRVQWEKRKLMECRDNKIKVINQINARLRSFMVLTPLLPELINKKKKASVWRDKLTYWREEFSLAFTDYIWEELFDLIDRLELAEKSLNRTEQRLDELEQKENEAAESTGTESVLSKLKKIKGVGDQISRTFSWYVGDFGRFKNSKHFASYFGLTPTPYNSCKTNRNLGISKAGKPCLRSMALQLAWLWKRHQKETGIYKKWEYRLQGQRSRKTSIVAMARQIIVALYHYIVNGSEIEGIQYS